VHEGHDLTETPILKIPSQWLKDITWLWLLCSSWKTSYWYRFPDWL